MQYFASTTLPNGTSEFIIWCICIGVCLAFIINYVYRTISGPFVRTLLAEECLSEERAKTLSELKFGEKKLIKFLLRDKSPLRNYVSVAGGSIPTKEIEGRKKPIKDIDNAKFYVNEAIKDKVTNAFGEAERFILVLLFIAIAIGCSFGMTKLVPFIFAIMGI